MMRASPGITPETDPWKQLDAVRAANLTVLHWEAKKKFETDKSSKNAEEMVALQGIREDHQKKTGWVAEHQGEGEWVFTYSDPTQVDPDTGYKTGQPITITTVAETR